MQQSFMERVYESMTDEISDEYMVPGVEYAVEEGSYCMNLYGEAYDAYRRLRLRLNAGEYDPDVEIIFHSFSQIQEELCYRMYRYGAQFGLRED